MRARGGPPFCLLFAGPPLCRLCAARGATAPDLSLPPPPLPPAHAALRPKTLKPRPLPLPASQEDLSAAKPDLEIASPSLCRALFEVYMGSAPVSPEARAAWAAGARALLRSEDVRRDTRRGGSG